MGIKTKLLDAHPESNDSLKNLPTTWGLRLSQAILSQYQHIL